jgi:hypothetical protein
MSQADCLRLGTARRSRAVRSDSRAFPAIGRPSSRDSGQLERCATLRKDRQPAEVHIVLPVDQPTRAVRLRMDMKSNLGNGRNERGDLVQGGCSFEIQN